MRENSGGSHRIKYINTRYIYTYVKIVGSRKNNTRRKSLDTLQLHIHYNPHIHTQSYPYKILTGKKIMKLLFFLKILQNIFLKTIAK